MMPLFSAKLTIKFDTITLLPSIEIFLPNPPAGITYVYFHTVSNLKCNYYSCKKVKVKVTLYQATKVPEGE
jgi:hypothetical protein